MGATLVQSQPGTGTSGTTVDITISGTAEGNTLIVAVGAGQDATNPVVSGITLGETALSAAAQYNNDSYVDCEQWYLEDIAAGQTAVTVTFGDGSGGDINYDVLVMEWSGLIASSPLDKVNGANNGGSSFSSGSTGTLSQAAEVIIGAVFAEGAAAAPEITGPGSPWTLLDPVSSATIAELLAGYLVAGADTAQTYSGTMAGPSPVYGATITSWKIAGTPHTATAALTVTPSFVAARTQAHVRGAALTVTPSFLARATGGAVLPSSSIIALLPAMGVC